MTLTIDEFRARVDASTVECKLCDYRGHSLIDHLKNVHKQTAGQYRKSFESGKLASPIVTELMRRMNRVPKSDEDLSRFIKAFEPKPSVAEAFKNQAKLLPSTLPGFEYLIPKTEVDFYFPEEETKLVVYALQSGDNIFNEGPTGCGKTELFFQVHAAMGRPIQRVNMNGDTTAANFIGKMEADPARGTFFKKGFLPICMEAGLPLLIDEIDYTPPQIAAILNPAMEKGRTIFLPETGEIIVAKPGFIVMGTANTGGKGDSGGIYTGTEVLNTAFLNRFGVKIKTDYLDQENEKQMLTNRFPHAPVDLITKMTKLAVEVRTSFKQGNISVVISTRTLISFFEMLPTLGQMIALKATFLNWLDDDDMNLVKAFMSRLGIRDS